jgi:anti-sigma factor RsiW
MKCSEVYRHICDNLDANLRTRRCQQIRLHLKTCPDCTAYLASLKTTVIMYRSVPAPRLPKGAHQRLMRALNAHGCLTGPVRGPRRKRSPGRR